MTFAPAHRDLKLTKQRAAFRQIEFAIEALELGLYDCAITLAGAAEGMLPESPSQAVFTGLIDHPKRPETISRKEFISIVNMERDSLKHLTHELPDEMEFSTFDAAIMIVRGMARLSHWSPRMYAFKEWYFDFINCGDQPATNAT